MAPRFWLFLSNPPKAAEAEGKRRKRPKRGPQTDLHIALINMALVNYQIILCGNTVGLVGKEDSYSAVA